MENRVYPIRHLWHWYFGNFCARKCRNEEELDRSHNCWDRMEEFCNKNSNLAMTHKEFMELFTKHITLCIFVEKESHA